MDNIPKNSDSMKPAHLAILLGILIIGIVNLLATLGIIGVGSWEYRVVTPAEMDSMGFKAIAAEEGIKPDEENKMQLPGEKAKSDNMLRMSLGELAKDGWEPVSVSLNGLYIFRR
jgi:hypothetical protein